MTDIRVGLLVDGDNLSASHGARLREAAAALGQLDVARVYGGDPGLKGWLSAPGFRWMQAGSGKNAADLMLCIDAIELALTGGPESLVLATSDGDFSHLALRLRELGRRVIGLGEDKTPDAFRVACTRFETLKPASHKAACGASEPGCAVSDLDCNIRAMIREHSTQGQGMRILDLNPRMRARYDFKISEQPEKTWRAYLTKRPALYDVDPRGPDAKVRFRPKGFARV